MIAPATSGYEQAVWHADRGREDESGYEIPSVTGTSIGPVDCDFRGRGLDPATNLEFLRRNVKLVVTMMEREWPLAKRQPQPKILYRPSMIDSILEECSHEETTSYNVNARKGPRGRSK